jgi:DDE superfamily endonuclease
VRHREKWRQALEMLDEITGGEQTGGWGLAQRPVVADAGFGDCTEFRLGLEARGLTYVVAVKSTTSAYPAAAEPAAPPNSGRGRPGSVGELFSKEQRDFLRDCADSYVN